MSDHPVVIVGAGYAGLVAGLTLRERNIPVVIFEASGSATGLAATFTDMEGFKYDFGTHLITNRLAKTLGVEDQCRDVAYFGESVVLNRKAYAYPFGLAAAAGPVGLHGPRKVLRAGLLLFALGIVVSAAAPGMGWLGWSRGPGRPRRSPRPCSSGSRPSSSWEALQRRP